jgi:hypothetical protein
MSSDLTRKRKHSDVSAVSTADRRQRATPSAALLPPAQPRDYEVATETAHSSTIRVEHCVAQDQARVQYGNTYVQNQYNGHTLGSQQHSGNSNQRIDFVQALAFDQMDSRYENIDPAHVNTCQWLFQKPEYVQWRDLEHLDSHNGFLWIKGKAGSGKSTLMKCAFEHARKHFRNDKIASFFFNARGQPLEKSVEGMYRSLLSQILRQFPQLRPEFPTFSPASVQQRGWTVPALRNHLHRAIAGLGQGDAITFYVDALDECNEDDIREAIQHFEGLGSSALSMPISLHICFASRYFPRVSIQRCIEIHVEEQIEHQQDIRNYINSKLIIRNVTFKAQLVSEIEARASGVFFWVVLVVRLINKRWDGGASHSEISTSLQEVPDKLQELIGAVLHSPDDALLCTLRWILFAKEPLTLEALYFAIRTGTGQLASGFWDTAEVDRDGMEAFILSASRGLVEMTAYGKSTKAQLIHESVREYLVTGGLKDLGSCSDEVVAASNHVRLFEWCQTYLRSITATKYLTIDGTHHEHSNDAPYPLLFYASEHILHHFQASYTAGLLRLDVLRDFPLRQYIYLPMHSSMLQPDNFFTSLLYISILGRYTQLAGAMLAENAGYTSRFDDRNGTSAPTSSSDLLAAKIDLNFQFERGYSSLLELAIIRCPSFVRTLVDHGADVNVDEGTPLCMALEFCNDICGMDDVVRLLLSRGAHAQAYQTSLETTALALAVSNGSLDIVELLLEHGADANGANGTPAASPLLAALGHSPSNRRGREPTFNAFDEKIAITLLDHGADIHLRAGPKQISPLEFAVKNRGDDVVRLLQSYEPGDVGGVSHFSDFCCSEDESEYESTSS